MSKVIIVRIGEVFLKGKNRYIFLKILKSNLNKALAKHSATLKQYHGRYVVSNVTDMESVMDSVLSVFGISSVSPAYLIEPSIESARKKAVELVSSINPNPASFRVSARRSDKNFPDTSTGIGAKVGEAIFEQLQIPVNLQNPELDVSVEIGPEISFVNIEKKKGPGGLPVGTSGHVEMLLSGGIDSPVAAWLLMKRGARLSATTFYSPPWVDEVAREKVITLCEKLQKWGGPERLHVVKFGEAQKILRKLRPAKFAVLLYRRLMVKTAEEFAKIDKAIALGTGESLGQVASQTIENMAVVQQASSLPMLQPLITYDKSETIELAKKLGLYETSIIPHDDSCTLFMPPKPEIKARIQDILKSESEIDLKEMALELVEKAETITF